MDVLHHFGQRDTEVPEVNPDGAPRRFTTDLGYDIELERGYLVIEQVQLVQCAGSGAGEAESALRLLWPRGIAHAHPLGGDPTLLGVPYVDSVLRADFALGEIGTMQPPPGRYCHARIVVAPADADAVGLPDDVDMVGLSLYLEGTYVAPGSDQVVPFILESDDRRELLIPLVDFYNGTPTPLILDDDHRDAHLSLAELTNFWLDGVQFVGATQAEETRRALDAISLTMHHHPGLSQQQLSGRAETWPACAAGCAAAGPAGAPPR